MRVRLPRAVSAKLPAAGSILVAIALVLTAVFYQGIPTAEIDVDDGGIWVTNQSRQLVGHMNYETRTLDSALRTQNAEFDITQHKDAVVLTDRSTSAVTPVDPATVRLTNASPIPQGAKITQGGQRMAILDPQAGHLWVTPADAPAPTFTEDTVAASNLDDGAVAATASGTVFALSGRGRLVTVTPKGFVDEISTEEISDLPAGEKTQLSAVGERPVAFEPTTQSFLQPDGVVRDLGAENIPAQSLLQAPGPEADFALLATDTELIEVPLDGGPLVRHPAAQGSPTGKPARPVRHQRCSYAAWGGSGAYLRVCDDASLNASMTVDTLKSAHDLVFRTNRSRIVLNQTSNGYVWLPDHDMVLMDDWEQIDSELKEKENEEESPQINEEIADPERQDHNTPPVAVDDEFGVRPDRSVTLPVLMNDSDADGDVLTARPVTQPKAGTVVRTRGGRALQISGIPDGSGEMSFDYEASDGKALDTATVRVVVHPWSVNEGPRQLRNPTVKVGANATVEYNVLTDWIDPDGDPVYLKNAQGTERLEVQFRQEGVISVRDLGAEPGEYALPIEVSDGQETTTGRLTVHVQPAGNLPPVVNADFYVVPLNETLVIEPLVNDSDPNGDRLSLVAVSAPPAGTTVSPDLAVGTVTFSAQTPGSYHMTYTVTDGPSTAIGVIRVDVVDVSTNQDTRPVAEDDLAVLRSGGYVTVAPLSNDTDPSGGVLVVQRIDVSQASELSVVLIDHHLLRISAPQGLKGPVSIPYVVTNGVESAQAIVTVVPSDAVDENVPPRLQPDRAKVRVGDIVSVNVLANDLSESGLPLRVDPKLQFTPRPEVGTPFITGNLVRLEAGEKPGIMDVSYTVRDAAGNMASSRVIFEVRPSDGTNAAPQPKSLTAWAVAGQTARIPVPLHGIDPDGDSVTLVGVEQSPQKGSVALGVDWLEYTPTAKASGTDTFTYIVEDRLGKQAIGRIRVGIAAPDVINQHPVAVRDTVRARPGRRLDIAVLANDIDADGDTLTLQPDSLEVNGDDIAPTIEDNVITLVTPTTEGTYVVSYGISDGRGGTSRGTLTVIVAAGAQLQPPIARDDVVTLAELSSSEREIQVKVLDNDEDPDGDVRSLKVSTSAPNVRIKGGTLFVTPEDRRRLVVYTVTDEDGLEARAIVSVPGTERTFPVVNENKVPVEVRAGQEAFLDISDLVIVRSGRSPRVTDSSSIKVGTGIAPNVELRSDTSIRFEALADFSGKTSITFEARDGAADDESSLRSTLSVPIKVVAAMNTPPTFTPTPLRIPAGGEPTILDLAQMVNDPDGQDPASFTYALVEAPSGVSVDLNKRELTVKAALDQPKGPVGSITVTVDDGSGPVTGAIPVTVVSSTRPLIQVSDAELPTAKAGKQHVIDLTQYTINPFPSQPIRLVNARIIQGQGTVDPQGTLLNVTPAAGFVGRMTVVYQLADATGDPDRTVEGQVRLIVQDRPAPPTNVSAQPIGAGKAVVSFQPGANNGAEITSFTITNTVTGATFQCEAASCPLEGLTNGIEHSFSVVAHNSAGASDSSVPSAPVLVDVRPERPAAPTVKEGDGQVTVSWTPPASEGSAVRSYTLMMVGSSTQQFTIADGATTYTVSGLENGKHYAFSVAAHNASPTPSDPSEPSSTAIPFGKPFAPSNLRREGFAPQDDHVTVSIAWDTPTLNGRPLTRAFAMINGAEVASTNLTAGAVNSIAVPVKAGAKVNISVAFEDSVGAVSPAQSIEVQTKGRPLPLRSASLEATGNYGQLSVKNVEREPGNGFQLADLGVMWTPAGQDQWQYISDLISLGSNGPQQIELRQVATGHLGETLAGESIVVDVSPYASPQIDVFDGKAETPGTALWRWSIAASDIGQNVTDVFLTINGTEHRVTGSNELAIDTTPGTEYKAELSVRSEKTPPVTSSISLITPGEIHLREVADCPQPPPPGGPESDPNQPPGDVPPPPPAPRYNSCYTVKIQAQSWHSSVGSLYCSYKDPHTYSDEYFVMDSNGTWTLEKPIINVADLTQEWITNNITCTSR